MIRRRHRVCRALRARAHAKLCEHAQGPSRSSSRGGTGALRSRGSFGRRRPGRRLRARVRAAHRRRGRRRLARGPAQAAQAALLARAPSRRRAAPDLGQRALTVSAGQRLSHPPRRRRAPPPGARPETKPQRSRSAAIAASWPARPRGLVSEPEGQPWPALSGRRLGFPLPVPLRISRRWRPRTSPQSAGTRRRALTAALVSPAIPDPKPARELAALMWSCERLRRRMVAMRFGRMLDSDSRVDRQVTGPRHVACVPADRGRSRNA
jgi:hypothetical protein